MGILDFFRRLLRSRYDSLGIGAKAKARDVELRAKTAVSSRFNKAIDSSVGKAKAKVTGTKPPTPKG